MTLLTKEEIIDLGWADEDSVDRVLEAQEKLTNGVKNFEVSTDDEELIEWLEEQVKLEKAVIIDDFSIEQWMVWFKNCECGISLDDIRFLD